MIPSRSEELFIAALRSAYTNARHGLIRRGSRTVPTPSLFRRLSCLAPSCTKSIGRAQLRRGPGDIYRGYATTIEERKEKQEQVIPPGRPRDIAVLGGGITGLTAAHYLARLNPEAHITLYDADDRLGGWIDGKEVTTEDGDRVLMHRGPRMLRTGATSVKYDDLVLYDVLANLKLREKLLYPKGAAQSRYIYYPDHLVKLPGLPLTFKSIVSLIYQLFTEPLFRGILSPAMTMNKKMAKARYEATQAWPKPLKSSGELFDDDETIAEFFERMFEEKDSPVVNNFLSAMVHGIYGGDVGRLSVKHSIFDRTWFGNINPLPKEYTWADRRDVCLVLKLQDRPELAEMANEAVEHDLMAFEDGLVTLVDNLVADLEGQENVTIKTGTFVSKLQREDDGILVSTSNGDVNQYHRVISTLFSGHTGKIASIESLTSSEAVTIMVVNLWYPNPDLLANNPGFGYLIPQTTPAEQNPEHALGVLFDSDLSLSETEKPGTKLTVMLGGHYWSDWWATPSESLAVAMARAVVERHLGISRDEPLGATSAKLCRDCIAQQTVGHRKRLADAHEELADAFDGRLMVAGPSYTSIGVIPAMRAGYDAAQRMTRDKNWFEEDDPGKEEEFEDWVGETGLRWAACSDNLRYMKISKADMKFKRFHKPPMPSPATRAPDALPRRNQK